MQIAIAVVLSLLAFVVAGVGAYYWRKRVHETMRRIATELGLQYVSAGSRSPGASSQPGAAEALGILATFGPWRLEGKRGDVSIACYPVTRGSGRSNTTYTVIEAGLESPLGLGLQLGKETALTRLGKAVLNLQDITVGNERFDAAARIKGSSPERIRSLLSGRDVQEAILRALEYSSSVTVTDQGARFETTRTLKDTTVFREVISLLTAVVEALNAARTRG